MYKPVTLHRSSRFLPRRKKFYSVVNGLLSEIRGTVSEIGVKERGRKTDLVSILRISKSSIVHEYSVV